MRTGDCLSGARPTKYAVALLVLSLAGHLGSATAQGQTIDDDDVTQTTAFTPFSLGAASRSLGSCGATGGGCWTVSFDAIPSEATGSDGPDDVECSYELTAAVCTDLPEFEDSVGDDCNAYVADCQEELGDDFGVDSCADSEDTWCYDAAEWAVDGIDASQACCVCGGPRDLALTHSGFPSFEHVLTENALSLSSGSYDTKVDYKVTETCTGDSIQRTSVVQKSMTFKRDLYTTISLETIGIKADEAIVEEVSAVLFKAYVSGAERRDSGAEFYYAQLNYKTDTAATIESLFVITSSNPSLNNCGANVNIPEGCLDMPSSSDFCSFPGQVTQGTVYIPLGATEPSTSSLDISIKTTSGALQRVQVKITAQAFVEQCSVSTAASAESDIADGIEFLPDTDFEFSISTGLSGIFQPVTEQDEEFNADAEFKSQSLITFAAKYTGDLDGVSISLTDIHIVWAALFNTLSGSSDEWEHAGGVFTTPAYGGACDPVLDDVTDCAFYHAEGRPSSDGGIFRGGTQGDIKHIYEYLGYSDPSNVPENVATEVATFRSAVDSQQTEDGEVTGEAFHIDPFAKGGQASTVSIHAIFEVKFGPVGARRTVHKTTASPVLRKAKEAGKIEASPIEAVSSPVVRFEVTPAAFAASVLGVPPEYVMSWELEMGVSDAEACLSPETLMELAGARLLTALDEAATAIKDVRVSSVAVNMEGVECTRGAGAGRGIKLGNARSLLSVGSPSIAVEALVVFDDAASAKPSIDKRKLLAAPGIRSAQQTEDNTVIQVVDEAPAPPQLGATSEAAASSSDSWHVPIIAGVSAVAVVAIAVAVAAVVWARRKVSGASEEPRANVMETERKTAASKDQVTLVLFGANA